MPSYEDVTAPIFLDETAQDIAEALRELKAVVQPTNVCIDLDVSLEISGWSNSAPYVYNWMNNKVTTECAVKVNFLEDSADTDQLYISYEKIVGGVQFEAETKPISAIPVRIHIVNAEADSITNITDEMVSTSVIPNAANVKQALTALKDADSALNSKLERTAQTVDKSSVDINIDALYAVRTGNIIEIGSQSGFSVNLTNVGTRYKVGTLPIGIAPSLDKYYIVPLRSGDLSAAQGYGELRVSAGGGIYITPLVAGYNLCFCVSYSI